METLAAAGLERVDGTGAWLREHRQVAQDPASIQVAESNDRPQPLAAETAAQTNDGKSASSAR